MATEAAAAPFNVGEALAALLHDRDEEANAAWDRTRPTGQPWEAPPTIPEALEGPGVCAGVRMPTWRCPTPSARIDPQWA